MRDVRPLAFLFWRSVVNGIKRALSSPKRLIGLAAFALYYYQLLLRPFSSHATPEFPRGVPRFDLPPLATIDAAVFGLVGVMSLLLMSTVLSYKGGFKAADVDVLFPTPVAPRTVLLFRIVRDTLVTLGLPLFVALIGYRNAQPALAPFFRDYPKQGGDILRALLVSYLLVSLVWVCVGYASSLFVNRSDLQSDRNRKRINVGITAILLGLLAYIALRLRADFSVATLVDVAHAPLVRIVLAPVTLATWATLGAFQGNYGFVAAGLFGLLAIIAAALRVALTQVGWMYDQAAVRGFDSGPNLRDLQRKGDMLGIMADRARRGKLKHGRIARRISDLRVRGPVALLWKEAILQARGSLSGLIVLSMIFLAATGLIVYSTSSSQRTASGPAILGMQGMLAYVLALQSAQGGFIELLRRVDVQKPLPFTPAVTVFWEVVAKAIAPSIVAMGSAVVGVVLAPHAWAYALAGVLIVPTLALALSAVVLLVILLFPDIEDPTQRMFRGLMLLLGIVIVIAPGVALLVLGIGTLGLSPLAAAPVVMALNLGMAVGLSAISGGLYANYNPSE